MLKKLVLLGCCITCFSYPAVQPESTIVTSADKTIVLPEISPRAFGVNPDEQYIKALRDFTHAIFAQYRFIKNYIKLEGIREKLASIESSLSRNAMNRFVFLDQTPEYGFMFGEEVGDKFFEKLEEVRQALSFGQDHELIIRTSLGIPIYAATIAGFELLLKHRSLFIEDIIDSKYKPLIDKICQDNTGTENLEVSLLVTLLKLKLERSVCIEEISATEKQLLENQREADYTSKVVTENYKLSEDLYKSLTRTKNLIIFFSQSILPAEFIRLGVSDPMLEARKKQALAMYEQMQASLYLEIRNQLREQIVRTSKKNRRVLVYSKTSQGELLPMNLEPIIERNTQRSEACLIQIPEKPDKKSPVKHTTQKSKGKGKKHKKKAQVISSSVISTGSQQAEQQDGLSVLESLSAHRIQEPVLVVQDTQEAHASAAPIEHNASTMIAQGDSAPAPDAPIKDRPSDDAEQAGTSARAVQSTQLVLINIPYSDGRVLSRKTGGTVVIDDCCNKMHLHLCQTDKCTRIPYKPVYKPNVLIWFESAQKALHVKNIKSLSEQNNTLRIHRFSRLVDQFIPTMGVATEEPSRIPGHAPERGIAIPGYVEFLESGKRKSCVFAYIVDSASDKCFHRNIQFKGAQKIFAEYYRLGSLKIDHPSLDS